MSDCGEWIYIGRSLGTNSGPNYRLTYFNGVPVFEPFVVDLTGYTLLGFNVATGECDFKPSDILVGKIADRNFYGPADIDNDTLGIAFTEKMNVQGLSPNVIGFFALAPGETQSRYYLTQRDATQTLALEQTTPPIFFQSAAGESTEAGGGTGSDVNLTDPPVPTRCLRMTTGFDIDPAMIGVGPEVFLPSSVADLGPAYETAEDGNGESKGTAAMWMVDRLREADSKPRITQGYRSHAQGGRLISEIMRGSQLYTNGLLELETWSSLGERYRKPVITLFSPVSIGANDRSSGTDPATFEADLVTYVDQINEDLPSRMTGTPPDTVYVISEQINAGEGNSIGNTAVAIPLAQMEVFKSDPRFLLSSCPYLIPYIDGNHQTAIGYDLIGEYRGKVMAPYINAYITGTPATPWKGLRPKTITVNGTSILIEFHVPVEPLQLITGTWNGITVGNFNGNYGFTYSDDQGATISSVSIYDDTHIELTMSTDVDAHTNRVTGYADVETPGSPQTGRSSVWGCLCDTDETESAVVPGLFLYNWGLVYREAIPLASQEYP